MIALIVENHAAIAAVVALVWNAFLQKTKVKK